MPLHLFYKKYPSFNHSMAFFFTKGAYTSGKGGKPNNKPEVTRVTKANVNVKGRNL